MWSLHVEALGVIYGKFQLISGLFKGLVMRDINTVETVCVGGGGLHNYNVHGNSDNLNPYVGKAFSRAIECMF